jgi:hypothetical protein
MSKDLDRDHLDVEHLVKTFEEHRGFDIDPDFSSDVPVPSPRNPTLPDSAIALPEPDEQGADYRG